MSIYIYTNLITVLGLFKKLVDIFYNNAQPSIVRVLNLQDTNYFCDGDRNSIICKELKWATLRLN